MFVSPSQRCLLDMELRQDFTFWMIFHLPNLSEWQKNIIPEHIWHPAFQGVLQVGTRCQLGISALPGLSKEKRASQ